MAQEEAKTLMGILDFFLPKRAKYRKLNEGHLDVFDRNQITEGWGRIEQKATSKTPSASREAVIEADKLLGYTLEKLYPEGESTGERLKAAKEKFNYKYQEYNDLWYAHKIRNEMVHNFNFELPTSQARDVLDKFQKGLEVLGVL
ncbi:MAG: hypothetical protein WD231_02140 [Candidatus Woykebacteria bacterium]